jgi:hypothetical protein
MIRREPKFQPAAFVRSAPLGDDLTVVIANGIYTYSSTRFALEIHVSASTLTAVGALA